MARGNPAAPPLDRKVLAVAMIVALGGVTTVLDMTIVGVALHTLSDYFDTGLGTIQWLTTAYILAVAMVVPATGWASDRFGGKRLWLTAVVLFTAGSVLCGLAWSVPSLIAFRVVQGLGAGMMLPVGMALVGRTAGRERMGRAMSLVGIPLVLGPVLGPVIGGVLVDTVSWRWIFLINLPIGIVAFTLASIVFDRDEPAREERLDVRGLMLLCPGVTLLIYGLANATSVAAVASVGFLVPFCAGAVLLAAFVRHAARTAKPLLDVRLFANRTFSSAASIHFVLGAALNGSMLLFPLYYQLVRGESALISGLLLVPQGIGVAMMMSISGRYVDKGKSGQIVLFGLPLIVLGFVAFTQVDDLVLLSVALWLIGVGAGCTMMPAMATAYRSLRGEQMAGATATFGIVQDIGASMAVATFIVVLDAQLAANPEPAGAFETVFWLPLVLSVAGVLPALLLARRTAPATEDSPALSSV